MPCGTSPLTPRESSSVDLTDNRIGVRTNMQKPLKLEEAPRISLQDAKAEFDRNAALFVDVRSREEYEICHIPGSISVPLREIFARADELLPHPSLIFYCT